jgi:hypothetical protein
MLALPPSLSAGGVRLVQLLELMHRRVAQLTCAAGSGPARPEAQPCSGAERQRKQFCKLAS